MKDIVERLREESASWKVGSVVNEAADEIERLRTALNDIAAFEPLTFAECSDAEKIIGIAKTALGDLIAP